MEYHVLESTKNKLTFELSGADNTLCNVLKDELRADKAVTVATYRMGHPLVRIPTFYIETNGKKDPLKALNDAIGRLKKIATKLKTEITALR